METEALLSIQKPCLRNRCPVSSTPQVHALMPQMKLQHHPGSASGVKQPAFLYGKLKV